MDDAYSFYKSGDVDGWWHYNPYHETNLAAVLQYPDGKTYNQYYFSDNLMSGEMITVPDTVYNDPNWGITTQQQKRAARLGMSMSSSGWAYTVGHTYGGRWYRSPTYLNSGLTMTTWHPNYGQGYTQQFNSLNDQDDSLLIPGYSTGVASLTWGDYKSIISSTAAARLNNIWAFSWNLGF